MLKFLAFITLLFSAAWLVTGGDLLSLKRDMSHWTDSNTERMTGAGELTGGDWGAG
jgi:hypothetical protein